MNSLTNATAVVIALLVCCVLAAIIIATGVLILVWLGERVARILNRMRGPRRGPGKAPYVTEDDW